MTIRFKKNEPFIEGVSLVKLTKKIETPFYIYSQKKITDAYNKIKKNINVEIFYAIKANSNQAIISILKNLGAGADVVSIGELKRALRAGINPKKIIFEGVGKSRKDIEFAIKKKIKQINVESIKELELINSISKSLKKKTKIGIRINPDIDAQTLDKISTGRKADKFGIVYDQLPEVCYILKNLDNVNLNGISCHIGSQIHNAKIFEKVFKKIKEAINIFSNNNIKIMSLDLGGGFGVTYNNEKEINLLKISNLINKYFRKKNFEISIEPGRYLVANSGVLVTKILTSKKNGPINYLITDAGMQTFLRPSMYKAFHKIESFSKNKKKRKYTIAGPICESSDILSKNIKLPEQKIGNYLAICDTGAYGFVMASNYNSKNFPAEILIHNKKFFIIRKSENIEKLISKDIMPKWIKS
tara:strand:- start:1005 stop:2249 length:1245 start_codon:yes stop_codon:yes gene_type:complete